MKEVRPSAGSSGNALLRCSALSKEATLGNARRGVPPVAKGATLPGSGIPQIGWHARGLRWPWCMARYPNRTLPEASVRATRPISLSLGRYGFSEPGTTGRAFGSPSRRM
jgi:hypothetical protein